MKKIVAWLLDGRKWKFMLLGTPLTLATAWAAKQLGLSGDLQTTIVTGVMAQVGIAIGGQAYADGKTGGKTSGFVAAQGANDAGSNDAAGTGDAGK